MVEILKLDIPVDRASLLRLARLFSHEDGTCLLYSGKDDTTSARSFLSLFPIERIWVYGQRQFKQQANKKDIQLTLTPWEGLKELLPSFNQENPYPSYFGFFGYEMSYFADDLKKQINYTPATTPDSYFQRAALLIVVDHQTGNAELIVEDNWQQQLGLKEQNAMKQLLNPCWWALFLSQKNNDPPVSNTTSSYCIEQKESHASYSNKVKRIKELIYSGDVYQVNLSQQFILHANKDPFDLFESLTQVNPAPYSAYFKLQKFAIACSSPELFLQKKGSRLLTRPIKGTIARGITPDQDERNRQLLLSSEKDRAELLMIVDLMRNDLGKISLPASVKTGEIWGCEAYNNVFHLVATISSNALPDLHPLQLIRSCFPGGSITGCPKLKAIEVIQQMETRARGIYTGSIGYFTGNGDFEFNIAIRTAFVQDDRINLQLGGAIVADSDPDQEYAETLQKGESFFKVLGAPS